MDAHIRLERGIKTGLGTGWLNLRRFYTIHACTDVSGGFSSSMIDAIRHAIQASHALHMKYEKEEADKDSAGKESINAMQLL